VDSLGKQEVQGQAAGVLVGLRQWVCRAAEMGGGLVVGQGVVGSAEQVAGGMVQAGRGISLQRLGQAGKAARGRGGG
jgi:hypothetical protein